MPTVSITSFQVQSADGAGELVAGQPAVVWAQCTSEHHESLTVQGSFSLGNGESGMTTIELAPGASEWLSWQTGPLDESGYDVAVTVSGELDMSSQVFDETGLSFHVGAAGGGAAAAGTAAAAPDVTLESLVLQPHSNVDHDDGTAWADESIRASVLVTAHGEATGPFQVVLWIDGGQSQTYDVELTAGTSEWYSIELDPLGVGTFQVAAAATWEGPDSSVLLGQLDRSLVTSERSGDWITANVQFRVNDFNGTPLRGYRIFSRFVGMDGSDAYGGETVEASENETGVVTCSGISLQPEGTVQVYAISEGDPLPALEGQTGYKLESDDTNLAFTVSQAMEERTYSAHSAEEVGEAVSAEFSTGVQIEIIEIGGTVATESSRSREYGEAVEWKVRVGRTNLEITQTS